MKSSVLARIAAQLSDASAIVDAVESQQVRRPGSTQEYVSPRDPFEQSIAEIWAALLRVERVGRMDDFFRLGGHSLLATQMVSRVWERFRVEVPLVEIFTGPTLESFARAVRAAVTNAEAAEVATQTPPTRTVRPARLPLSYGQQRLWFLDQLDSGNASQNVALKWRLRGDLDTTALQSALNEIVARHEVLRTTFGMDGGEPVQVIAPARVFVLPITDLGALPEAEREERARSLVNEETGRPFDLQRGPVFRAKLLRLSEKEHVLVFNIHHIATDGWSFGVFRKELATLYEAFMAGKPSPLPPLPQQYADYSVWQRTHVEGGPFQKQLEYWKEQLLNAPPSIELPTDHPRPAVQTYRGASRVAVLSSDLTKALKALSQQEGVTLFMTLLAAFNVLLSRYSGQEDIVVGTAIAGRTRGDTEKMIGLFLNTLA
ncbi:MAG: condensation domain-containing protein, partial [Acidobacteriota bacterium]|nr:condensation domain-containing protein [Acidobacteriota bacterium]